MQRIWPLLWLLAAAFGIATIPLSNAHRAYVLGYEWESIEPAGHSSGRHLSRVAIGLFRDKLLIVFTEAKYDISGRDAFGFIDHGRYIFGSNQAVVHLDSYGITYEAASNAPQLIFRVLSIKSLLIASLFPIPLLIWLMRHPVRLFQIPEGCCQSCGYDLRASKDRCPECGSPISSEA